MASEQKDDPQCRDKRAIIANPRIEKCTDAFLIAKGIKTSNMKLHQFFA